MDGHGQTETTHRYLHLHYIPEIDKRMEAQNDQEWKEIQEEPQSLQTEDHNEMLNRYNDTKHGYRAMKNDQELTHNEKKSNHKGKTGQVETRKSTE